MTKLPCEPDHNGECLVCDCWMVNCPVAAKMKAAAEVADMTDEQVDKVISDYLAEVARKPQ